MGNRKAATQTDNPLSYAGLHGEWATWLAIARKFERRAPVQDREDLRHDIILELALARDRDGDRVFTQAMMCRIASYVVADYWRKKRRRPTSLSLDAGPIGGNGHPMALMETIADDRAIDLDAWLDARVFLLSCPPRLVRIAHKKRRGDKLTPGDSQYLWRYRKRGQIFLPAM